MVEQRKKGTVAAASTNSPNVQGYFNRPETKNQPDSGIPMPDAWDEPVNGLELVQKLRALYERYLVLPYGASIVLAFWALHTYAVNAFDYSPRLCIKSAAPQCGKTQLLQLLELTTYSPVNISSITASGIFRTIAAWHPTLLIDEADTYINGNNEIRGIVNAGYKRGGKVLRTIATKNDYTTKTFDCYGAMAIAGIGNRDATIMDRSITIVMRRAGPHDRCVEKLRERLVKPQTTQLQSMCMRYMMDNVNAISEIFPDVPNFLNGRKADIWEPLFAIAHHISPDLVSELADAAARLCPMSVDVETRPIQLLADISQVFENTGADFLATDELLRHLYQFETRPWADKEYGKTVLTSITLAGMLRDFDIRPQQVRIGNKIKRGYARAAFTDAFERYVPQIVCDPVTTQVASSAACNGVTNLADDASEPAPVQTNNPDTPDAKGNNDDTPDVAFKRAEQFFAENSVTELSDDDILDLPDIPY